MSKVKHPFKVLVWGDYKCQTGFATVLHNLIPYFQSHYGKRWHMDVIAINWFGIKVTDESQLEKVPKEFVVEREEDGQKVKRITTVIEDDGRTLVKSAVLCDGKDDAFGRHIFLTHVKHFEYDMIFIINDLGVVMPHIKVMREWLDEKRKLNKKQAKIVYYFPVDSPPLKGALDDLHLVDLPVVYTEYGKSQVLKIRPTMKGKLKTILHGVNISQFKPLSEANRLLCRKEIFNDPNEKRFIITNINRNQHRKDIPSTILAYEKFLLSLQTNGSVEFQRKPLLYLHMNPEDQMGWNLWILVSQTSLKYGEDILFMPDHLVQQYPEPEYLNCIYNASDLFITTTTGEGFGLTVLEAMASGCLVMAPNNTSLAEICRFGTEQAGAIELEESYPFVDRYDSIIRSQVSIDEAAEKLMDVFLSGSLGVYDNLNRVRNAHTHAQGLSWENISKRWIDELDRFIG